VTRRHPKNVPQTSDNHWLIIGISVGCGLLLIIIIIIIIIVVVCCRRRDQTRDGSTELDHCPSVNNTTSGTEARRNEYDTGTAENRDYNYYSTIPDDNEYCKPCVSPHGNDNNAYSALGLPELPKRSPKPGERFSEPTVGLTEPSKDSSPYYLAVC